MAVLLDKNTRLIVQGITGREGTFHAKAAQAYHTNVVGGVTPGKGGTTHEGWPVFNTVEEAVKQTGANASVIFVPPPFAADAIMEAADAGVALVVCITEGIPVVDMMKAMTFLKDHPGTRLIGPNCPGIIRKGKAGIIPANICKEGRIGIVSKSGTLTYEAIDQLDAPARPEHVHRHRWRSADWHDSHRRARLFQDDPETDAVIMIGEIGGSAEEEAGLDQGALQEADRGVHRGPDRAAGTAHGSRGRDHCGRQGTAAEKMAALTAAGVRS